MLKEVLRQKRTFILLVIMSLFLILFLIGCSEKESENQQELLGKNLLTGKVAASEPEGPQGLLRKCMELDQKGQSYFLERDLVTDEENCLKITADEVSLDCQGNTIRGRGRGRGIYLDQVRKATVQNCRVTDFKDALWLESSSNNYLYKNTLTDNEGNGLVLKESTDNYLAENSISGNDENGIYLIYSSDENKFSRNRICGNDRKDLNCQLSRGNYGDDNQFEKFAACSDNFPESTNQSRCDFEIKCEDPDGNNYLTAGQTTGYWLGPNSANPLVTEMDACLDIDTVKEYLCNEEGNNIISQEIECPMGCFEGACLPEEERE